MLVVCDTSPLRYLVEIRAVDALPKMYGRVFTTPSVLTELQMPHFPPAVKAWGAKPAPWLEVESPVQIRFALGSGESSALSLAIEKSADLVLIDERVGARTALQAGLKSSGTLGVILEAALRGLIDFDTALARLTLETRFRCTEELTNAVRAQYRALLQRMNPHS